MYAPLLELAKEEFDQIDQNRATPLVRIAGLCGQTEQAVNEATCAREQGFHMGLLSLAALKDASFDDMLEHCRQVAAVIPIMGFYLQAAVGGRLLPYKFWREFAALENVVAIKAAPFNRYPHPRSNPWGCGCRTTGHCLVHRQRRHYYPGPVNPVHLSNAERSRNKTLRRRTAWSLGGMDQNGCGVA